MEDPRVRVHDTPVVSRWSLFALGTIQGDKVKRPRDPVAAYLLESEPHLLPPQAVGSVLTMIRARTAIIDRMIEEEVGESIAREEGLDYWSVGGGFDARWYRIKTLMNRVVRKHFEVDQAAVLDLKDHLLSQSTFRKAWGQIAQHQLPTDAWTVRTRGHGNLVCLEGVSTRLPPEALRDLLLRIRADAPNARVIIDIPCFVSMLHSDTTLPRDASGAELDDVSELDNPFRWRHRYLREIGWEVREDTWLTNRPAVDPMIPGFQEQPGMEGFRVLRLRATPDRNKMRVGTASVSLGPRRG